jgi:fructose-1,6-bisphosphatase/inositol monophosphatase family enzyme
VCFALSSYNAGETIFLKTLAGLRSTKVDWFNFVAEIRVALYQCGAVSKKLKGKVAQQHKEPEPFQISTAISDVDRICQELLLLHAYQMMPDVEISSEEIVELPPYLHELYNHNSNRYVIVIDPMDGTDCYLTGGIEYAHMLGVLDQESKEMLCGLVYFPELSKLYFGIRDVGSFVEETMFGDFKRLTTGVPPKTFGEVKRLRDSDYKAFQEVGFSLDSRDNKSAAYAQIRVAEASLGAMVMRHFHGYDTAIPSIIIEELGGAVLGEDGKKVTYVKEMPRMPLVISSILPQFSEELYKAQKD